MFNVYDYEKWQYKKIKIFLVDGTTTTGELLSIDDILDNDIDDALVLDVDGDVTVGRAVYQKDIERVELLD